MIESHATDLLDNLNVPIILVQAVYDDSHTLSDVKVIYVNKQYKEQTKGFAKPGDSYSVLKKVLPKEIDWLMVCDKVIKSGQQYEDDYLTLRLHVWFHMAVQKFGEDMVVFTLSNVTSVKIKEKHLEFLEMNDKKTGLANSASFNKSLEVYINEASQRKELVGLIVMNIDNMRSLNDFTGREAGDALISKAASILASAEGTTTHIYRLEGDEFALIKEDAVSSECMMEQAGDILAEFSRNGVSMSMGIALYPIHDVQARSLVKDADLAMHFVKGNGKGNYALFKVDMYNNFLENVQIQKKIVAGLEKNQFMLYYQPQFYLGGHKLRGFEALIRWRDEEGKWHAPQSFIPVAEETNTIQVLGSWVLETAVAQLKKWQEQYGFEGIISVNVSPVQLKSPRFVSDVRKVVQENDIRPGSLELEITEGVFITDTEATSKMLHELQKMNIKISLDDFGTGYSSLRYLGSMPINTLKLDKSFIDSIEMGNAMNIDILSSLIPVIRRAGMETIAEGVEQPELLSILTDIDCNCVQGFLWGKPIPTEKCDRFLQGDESALDKISC